MWVKKKNVCDGEGRGRTLNTTMLYTHAVSSRTIPYSGKLSRISWFVAIHESFLREIWERGVLWHGMSEQSTKVFSVKIVFFTNSQKFSSSKVSRYTAPLWCTLTYCKWIHNTMHLPSMIKACLVKIRKFSPLKYFRQCTEQRKLNAWKIYALRCRTIERQNNFYV